MQHAIEHAARRIAGHHQVLDAHVAEHTPHPRRTADEVETFRLRQLQAVEPALQIGDGIERVRRARHLARSERVGAQAYRAIVAHLHVRRPVPSPGAAAVADAP